MATSWVDGEFSFRLLFAKQAFHQLTVAMTELATKNLISGSVRFFYGLVITLELGIGIAIGTTNHYQ